MQFAVTIFISISVTQAALDAWILLDPPLIQNKNAIEYPLSLIKL